MCNFYKMAHCRVCEHARRSSCDHDTRSPSIPQVNAIISSGHWPLNREIEWSTKCPTLMATVCTNPLCFNGENGLIRFPMCGHSRSHCPCDWPKGWEENGELAHLRVTGIYDLQSQFVGQPQIPVQVNNSEPEEQSPEFDFEDFIKTQESLERGDYKYETQLNCQPPKINSCREHLWFEEGQMVRRELTQV